MEVVLSIGLNQVIPTLVNEFYSNQQVFLLEIVLHNSSIQYILTVNNVKDSWVHAFLM